MYLSQYLKRCDLGKKDHTWDNGVQLLIEWSVWGARMRDGKGTLRRSLCITFGARRLSGTSDVIFDRLVIGFRPISEVIEDMCRTHGYIRPGDLGRSQLVCSLKTGAQAFYWSRRIVLIRLGLGYTMSDTSVIRDWIYTVWGKSQRTPSDVWVLVRVFLTSV